MADIQSSGPDFSISVTDDQRNENSEFLPITENPSPTPVLTDFERHIFIIINHVILATLISLFGLVANIINCIIFVKQGLNSTMNISLFAISIFDFLSLLALLELNVLINPYFENSDLPVLSLEMQYLIAGWPNGCFARVSCWITIYMTIERCCCIVFPLKVKQMFTPTKTVVIICLLCLCIIISVVPEYATLYIDWKHDPIRNRSALGLLARDNRGDVEGFVFIMHAVIGVLSFVAISLFTAILIIYMKKSIKFRAKTTVKNEQANTISKRDRRSMNMVKVIAIILIICYFPDVVFFLVGLIHPDFGLFSLDYNLFHTVWSFSFLLQSFMCTVNIFLYYRMSSNYRKTFKSMFSKCYRKENTVADNTENTVPTVCSVSSKTEDSSISADINTSTPTDSF